jgi:hypothetical protein
MERVMVETKGRDIKESKILKVSAERATEYEMWLRVNEHTKERITSSFGG